MKQKIKSTIVSSLQRLDIGVTRYSSLKKLRACALDSEGIDFVLNLPENQTASLLKNLRKSKSQLRQDLFVLSELAFKRNGYFVEFGATNGVDLSNTYLMEKEFGWTGILAEPARCWHVDLKNNRNARIEMQCVWKDSNSVLNFNEVNAAEYSTIDTYSDSDLHKKTRENGTFYNVKTISLNDLLKKHEAPESIDYLSIDTEGSEFEILSNFEFQKYHIKVITCEHNFTPMREKIHALLYGHGYVRKFEHLSRFDDWYVKT
jgi:FkbM family methyltransferase